MSFFGSELSAFYDKIVCKSNDSFRPDPQTPRTAQANPPAVVVSAAVVVVMGALQGTIVLVT